MRSIRFLRTLALLPILCAGVMQAEVINYNATFNSTTNFYFNFQNATFNLSQTNFNANPIPSLSGNFNPGDQFRATLSAPTGFAFSIEPPPTGTTFHRMIVRIWSTGNPSTRIFVPGGTFEFNGLTGNAPTLVESFFFYNFSGQFGVEALFDVEAGSFQSLSMLFDVPTGFNHNQSPVTPYIEYGVYAGVSKSITTGDPGPRAFIIPAENPVPEPSLGFLAAGALAAFAWKRRNNGA
jgi:hypothetical protein